MPSRRDINIQMLGNCTRFFSEKKTTIVSRRHMYVCIPVLKQALETKTQLRGGSGENVAGWIRHATPCRMHPFIRPFRGRHLLDPASESKAKRWQNWHTAGILNGALCRWRRTAAAKRITLGLQRTLRSPSPRHGGATRPFAGRTARQRHLPRRLIISHVTASFVKTSVRRYSLHKKGQWRARWGRGEAKIRVRIISTGSSWREKRSRPQALLGQNPKKSESRRPTRGRTVELTAMTPLFCHGVTETSTRDGLWHN